MFEQHCLYKGVACSVVEFDQFDQFDQFGQCGQCDLFGQCDHESF